MFEFFQVFWDLFILRDASRKGQMTKQVWVFAAVFLVLLYAILLPAALLWQKHPQYKPLFIAAVVLDGIVFIVGMVLAWKLRVKTVAAGQKRIAIGSNDEVIYSGVATIEDAKSLGDSLKTHEYFQDLGVTVLLDKSQSGTTISFVTRKDSWDEPGMLATFETIVRDVASSVGGLPIELHLVDKNQTVEKSSTVAN